MLEDTIKSTKPLQKSDIYSGREELNSIWMNEKKSTFTGLLYNLHKLRQAINQNSNPILEEIAPF